MYNKLFCKILDSSIWLEPTPTRIVWVTVLAAMDEEGFAPFASVANLAHRARVALEEAEEAVRMLEGPDPNSSDPDNDGRRIERTPGGWLVLNAGKYRAIATRAHAQEQARERVRRHRERRRTGNARVTGGNASAAVGNESVTISDTETDTNTGSETDEKQSGSYEEQESRSGYERQPAGPTADATPTSLTVTPRRDAPPGSDGDVPEPARADMLSADDIPWGGR